MLNYLPMDEKRITIDQVRHVARLARLELSADEEQSLQSDLSAILAYVDKLNQLNTDEVEPTAKVGELRRRARCTRRLSESYCVCEPRQSRRGQSPQGGNTMSGVKLTAKQKQTLRGAKPRTSSGSGQPFKYGGKPYASVRDLVDRDPATAVAIYNGGSDALRKANKGMTTGRAGALTAILGRYVRAAQG